MTPTYTAKILKLAGGTLDIELKAAFNLAVGYWPSLALRALADAPGSPLAGLDLGTNAGIAELARTSIARVEILATRKGLAQYRVHAREGREKAAFGGLKKGMGWPTSACSSDYATYVAAARAGQKLVAAVVAPGSAVPSGAVEILAFTKNGPGATKVWLDHPGASGVACRDGRVVSWGGGRVRTWTAGGELHREHPLEAIAADLWRDQLVTLTAAGLSVEGQADRPGVRAFAVDGDRLWTIDGEGQATAWDGERVERQFPAIVPGDGPFRAVAQGGDLLVSGADLSARWYRDGVEVKAIVEEDTPPGAFHGLVMVDGEPLSRAEGGGLGRAKDGRVLSPPMTVFYVVAAADRVLGVRGYCGVTHATLWDSRGEHLQQHVLPAARLKGSQEAVQLSPGGTWIVCPEAEKEQGGVLLTGTRGQGQVRFPNPKADDFLTVVVALDEERFLVGYGNHDALIWHVDGRPPASLGRRVDRAHAAGGRLVTAKDAEVTAWSAAPAPADLAPAHSWTVEPSHPQWLEVSGDGRQVLYGAWIADAPYRGWVRDLETGESWEIEQAGGPYFPTFAGDASRFFCNTDQKGSKDWHIWDARTRRRLLTLPDAGHVYAAAWGEGGTFWTSVGGAIHQRALADGAVLFEQPAPPAGHVRVPLTGAAFTTDFRLVTTTITGKVEAWKSPTERASRGGAHAPVVFEPEPGVLASLQTWPGEAVLVPKTR